jgi:hypothetical protein
VGLRLVGQGQGVGLRLAGRGVGLRLVGQGQGVGLRLAGQGVGLGDQQGRGWD